MMNKAVQQWNSNQYDDSFRFVSQFGEALIDWLKPQAGERILDLGCGTGDLAYAISLSGADVTGSDLSKEMIETAQKKYPAIPFYTSDASEFRSELPFDAVFSNAALHWMKHADQVVQNIASLLRPGGRFICEFGGFGNVSTITQAIISVLSSRFGIDASSRIPWYFPTIGQYSSLVESHGLMPKQAILFDRPTPMEGSGGLALWMDQFADVFFEGLTAEERQLAYRDIEKLTKKQLFRDNTWYIDYCRIRISALRIE
jgi:ubiquinone/menaquinone biosynthesis C-methylase UbiE